MNSEIQAKILIKSLRLITSIAIAILIARLLVIPQSSPLVMTPWLFLPVIFMFIFPVLPWHAILKNVSQIRSYLWLEAILVYSLLVLISWTSGSRSWWAIPITALTFVPAFISLNLTPNAHPKYWQLSKWQWWVLIIWPLMWLGLWWAALHGPGVNPKEAYWMARITFASTVAAIVLVVVLGGQLDGRHLKETRNLAALQCVVTSAAWVILSNIFESWLFNNSLHTQPTGYSLWLWLILGIFIVAAFRYRTASIFADIVFGLGAIWMLFSAWELPAVAPTSLVNLFIVLSLLLGHRRIGFLILAWAGTLLLSWIVPGAEKEQVILNGLSGIAVGIITVWLLRELSHSDKVKALENSQNSIPTYRDETHEKLNLTTSQSRIAYAIGIGTGALTALSGVVLTGEASTAYIQSMILLGILVGLAGYTIAHYWFGRELVESSLREKEKKFRGLFHHAPDGYLLMEGREQMRVIACNKAAEIMLRGAADKIIGLTPADLSPMRQPSGELSTDAEQWRIQRKGEEETYNFEWLHKRLDESEFWAQVMITIMPIGDNETTIVSLREITEKKRAEEKAEALAKRLEKQNNTRVQLLKNSVIRDEKGIDSAFELITKATTDALEVNRASIWLYSKKDEHLYCQSLYDAQTQLHSSGQFLSMKEYPHYFRAIASGEKLVVSDLKSDYRISELNEDHLESLNITSKLDFPIFGNEGILGVICCEHTETPREWNLDEEKFVGFLSDFTALCLEAHERRVAEREALAYQHELEIIKENLEQQVIERTKTIKLRERELELQNSILEDSVKQRTQALLKSNKDLASFAFVASHDLRAPLRAIRNLSSWIQEDLASSNSLNGEIKNDFSLLMSRIDRMENLVVSLLEYSRLDNLSMESEHLNLHLLVDELIDLLQPPKGFVVKKYFDIDVIKSAKIPLQRIFLNILNNAIQHHDNPNEALLTIHAVRDKDKILFKFSDNGPGIPPHLREKALDMFSTLTSKDENENSGMGLAIVKKLVLSLMGSIELTENVESGRGLVVILILPNTINH